MEPRLVATLRRWDLVKDPTGVMFLITKTPWDPQPHQSPRKDVIHLAQVGGNREYYEYLQDMEKYTLSLRGVAQ